MKQHGRAEGSQGGKANNRQAHRKKHGNTRGNTDRGKNKKHKTGSTRSWGRFKLFHEPFRYFVRTFVRLDLYII